MSSVFVIRNHLGQFLSRQKEWLADGDVAAVFAAQHRDQAINTLVEVNAHEIDMRCQVLEATADDRGRPQLADIQQDPGLAKPAPPVLLDEAPDVETSPAATGATAEEVPGGAAAAELPRGEASGRDSSPEPPGSA
jgi:hypothetical protein